MITRLGYQARTPYAIVFWYRGDVLKAKTICYDEQELQVALQRHTNVHDKLYYAMTPIVFEITKEAVS